MAETVHRVTSPFSAISGALPLRALTGYEEEYIDQHRHDPNTARLCNEILARCLVEPGNEPSDRARARIDNLLVAERDLELIRLRSMSLGSAVISEVSCPSCGAANDVDFELSSLSTEFQRPPECIEIRTSDGTMAVLRSMSAGDQAKLLDASADTRAERRSWLLSMLLLEWNAESGPFDLHFVRALTSADRAVLDKGLVQAVTGLDLSMNVECSECGVSFDSPFDVGAFFLPS